MPLAIGHLAVGVLTNCAFENPKNTNRKKILLIFALANSPDIDIVISWLLAGNPFTYHRLFTHSILFTVLTAAACVHLPRLIPSFPKVSYSWCYWIISSHVIADYLISPFKVSFLWPLPIRPESLNGALDFVGRYASLTREVEVLCFCALAYGIFRIVNAAVGVRSVEG